MGNQFLNDTAELKILDAVDDMLDIIYNINTVSLNCFYGYDSAYVKFY